MDATIRRVNRRVNGGIVANEHEERQIEAGDIEIER